MSILMSDLWAGLVGALLLGLCIGVATGLPRGRSGLAGAGLLVAMLAALAGLAALRTLPGEAGLWTETAALMLAVYLGGCLAGGLGRLATGHG